MTGAGASCILLEKVLDVAGLSMDTWKTGWTEHMESGRQRVNDRVSGWAMISQGLRYFSESFFEGRVVWKN